MGVCFMLVILKQFHLPNLRVATTLLCLAFVYGARRAEGGTKEGGEARGRLRGRRHALLHSLPLPPSISRPLPWVFSPADVWWVFLQPLVTGGASVMVEVATGGASHEQLPMVLRVPHRALGTNPAFAILGLGAFWGDC